MKNKKIIIAIVAVLIAAVIGVFVYFRISNNKYLFVAYLEEHGGEYTLVVRNNDYISFREMWKVEDTQMDNGHIKMIPWMLDERISKVTKVEIKDNIKIRSFSFWFYNMSSLKEIVGLDKIDTTNLLSMSATFKNCSSLTELDLSSFNTKKVTIMSSLFSGCSNLKTIYVGDNWSVDNVTYSEDMFKDCTKLVGQHSTEYDDCATDKLYAQIDTIDNGGYLSKK